ncbi:conserved Plasmodium protein, unknown function [Plasmodium gallinaceum]|uniref:Uncharacterized protein n=1 Tax=Plasmodium gallinaceum TaxID=5849 RepID=A0A1J1H0H9_PLAGA|nr:conserved Plasmodium protein, unknown function [Plasmodium gallinaceum]CRG98204.1 conserved Plasmodium protein, unknown function [Plasmodium gallinaceum]
MNKNIKNERKCDNEREIILLGFLNMECVYGKNWFSKKNEIKKDIEYKAVKLNQAFKHPSIFHENFEFLSADDYNYVKNNYIYSAILIFNPNLTNKNSNEEKENNKNSVNNSKKNVYMISNNKKSKENKSKIENIKIHENEKNTEECSNDSQLKEVNNETEQIKDNLDKKKEGIGVLVVTCKKMEKIKMKHILIKMLKKEIKVESTVLKCKDKISNYNIKNNEDNKSKSKLTEIKYLDKPDISLNINKPFDVKKNNFFNMTAYIYGSSNILANTSLVQREYCDDEWAEKLRRTKKEKAEINKTVSDNNKESRKETGLIRSFTSLFKK